MKFRRNFEKVGKGQTQRKGILLIGTVLVIILLTKLISDTYGKEPQPNTIFVQMLNRNSFIINSDTTNYQQFASILKRTVILAKHQYPNNTIQLSLPKVETSKEVADIIMIIGAMDLEWEIKN